MKKIISIKNLYKNILNESFYNYESNKRKIITVIRIIKFTLENYRKTRSNLWASSISYYSLLSIVPILAIAFSIAKGLGVEHSIRTQILKNSPLQEDALEKLITFSEKLMASAKGGILAGVGLIFLAWAIIKIFALIERSFNEIWNVKRQRNLIRKFTDYFSIIIMFPVVVLFSNGITTALQIYFLDDGSHLSFVIKWIPYILLILFFTLVYLIIPNTKVGFQNSLLAGIIVGILFQGLQFSMIKFQVVLLNYNKIYGSFSIIPIFIVWQKIVWMIIIFGAHLSFILQNSYKFGYTVQEIDLTFSSKRDILFMICYLMTKNYEEEECPITAKYIAEKLSISINTIGDMLETLLNFDVILEVFSSKDEREFKLKKNINTFSIGEFIDILENNGFAQNIQGNDDTMSSLSKFHRLYKNNEWDTLIKDI